jgi:hypothetical protein
MPPRRQEGSRAPRVFFSFDYEDVETFRANVVRKHGLTKETGESGFNEKPELSKSTLKWTIPPHVVCESAP